MNDTFYLKPHMLFLFGGIVMFFLAVYQWSFDVKDLYPLIAYPVLAITLLAYSGAFFKRKGLALGDQALQLGGYYRFWKTTVPYVEIETIKEDKFLFRITLKSGKLLKIIKQDFRKEDREEMAKNLSKIKANNALS